MHPVKASDCGAEPMAPIGGAPVKGNGVTGGVTAATGGALPFVGGWPTCPGGGAGNAPCASTSPPATIASISCAIRNRIMLPPKEVIPAPLNIPSAGLSHNLLSLAAAARLGGFCDRSASLSTAATP